MMTIRAYLFQAAFYLYNAVLVLGGLPMLLASRRRVAQGIAFYEGGIQVLMRTILGISYRLEGTENIPDGPKIFALVHQSAWETLVIHRVVNDPAIVLKKELAQIPFWGWYTRRAGLIAVDRQGGTKALRAMVDDAQAALDRGQPIAIFPQGTRTPPGTRVPYHTGIAALYDRLKVPVVPVAHNAGVFWGYRGMRPQRTGTIRMRFLPAIPGGLPRKEFMRQLEQSLEPAAEELAANPDAPPPAAAEGAARPATAS